MRVLFLPLLALLLASGPATADGAAADPTPAESPPLNGQGVRLLVLDLEGALPGEEREVLAGLVEEGLRGREQLLIITSDDVRKRAPLEADRMAGCREELCLFELADAVDAAFVLFADAQRDGPTEASTLALRLALFERRSSRIVSQEQLDGESASSLSGFVRPALDRVLAPTTSAQGPSLFERPLFLTGTALAAVGTALALGAGGWALEMNGALANPDIHRDEKQRALEFGPPALWLTAGAAAVAVVGAGLMGLATVVE